MPHLERYILGNSLFHFHSLGHLCLLKTIIKFLETYQHKSQAPFTRERNGTERHGTVPENKGIFAGVHTRTIRNVLFRSEKWTALKSES